MDDTTSREALGRVARPLPRADQEPQMSDEEIEQMKRQRFQQRVQRVLEVMRQERIDWRGVAYITSDGRIGVRIVPAEMIQP